MFFVFHKGFRVKNEKGGSFPPADFKTKIKMYKLNKTGLVVLAILAAIIIAGVTYYRTFKNF